MRDQNKRVFRAKTASRELLLFLAFLAHFGAILFHTLIVRDGMLFRMVPWNVRPRELVRGSGQPTSRSERVEV